jgi:hypothetical protein
MNFVLQPWQLLFAVLAGWSSPLPRRTQPPRLGQSPHQPGRRDRAFHRRSALSAAPRRRLALLLPIRRLAPFLRPRTAEPPGDRARLKGRVAACRGWTKPLGQVPRSYASAQTIHSRHTKIHIFHPDSLRSSFLTIRAPSDEGVRLKRQSTRRHARPQVSGPCPLRSLGFSHQRRFLG